MASYRKRHIKSKIHKIKPKKSIFRRPWFWLSLLILAVVLSVGYFALFYSGLQLKNVIISGNDKVKNQDLLDLIANDSHTGLINFWNIKIDSGSIFLINTDKINKDILKKFPEIEKVVINKKLPQTLTLRITERKPLGVFCSNDNKCFLIDDKGVIFELLATVSQGITIVRQVSEDGQIFTGEEVIAQNIIDAISKIQKSLKDNFQIDLKEVLISSPVRLDIKTNENWQIYFDLSPDTDINSQLTKLNLLLNGGISSDSRKNLRYIDLRPKDRAIVCDNKTCGG